MMHSFPVDLEWVENAIADMVARMPVPVPDECAARAMSEKQANLTKPQGSLGRLEELSVKLASIQGTPQPSVGNRLIVVFAADHGVARQHVSAYPQRVTREMLMNFARGGAAINAIARTTCTRLRVLNVGVIGGHSITVPHLEHRVVRESTHDFTSGVALAPGEVFESINIGMALVDEEVAAGLELLVLGEMGIGNTTSASAITALSTQSAASLVTGRGSGISDEMFRNKIRIIEAALHLHKNTRGPIAVLGAVGGLEIGAMTGAILRAAQLRVPVVLDGFIVTVAAWLAYLIDARVRDYMIAGHLSTEPGHGILLGKLKLDPLVQLGLRLGEGSGAAICIPLLNLACELPATMATFEAASVSRSVLNGDISQVRGIPSSSATSSKELAS